MKDNNRRKRWTGRLPMNRIVCIDALEGLRSLPDECVDCAVTSPPYWALRDYGVKGQIGLEPDPEAYLSRLLAIFDEVRRVLTAGGTCWVNLGDTYGGNLPGKPYASRAAGRTSLLRNGTEHFAARGHARGRWDKCLMGIPERFMLAMLERGWTLRNKVIWHKPNGMPCSVKDRLATKWEYLYFFTKAKRYRFDLDAIRVPHKTKIPSTKARPGNRPSPSFAGNRMPPRGGEPGAYHPKGKNPGDCWSISPETRSLAAMTGPRGAVKVPGGSGWVGHVKGGAAAITRNADPRWLPPKGKNPGDCWEMPTQSCRESCRGQGHCAVFPEKLVERPIKAGCPPGGVVLDPFMGSGTTAVVARRLNRRFIGFELNPDYIRLARRRLRNL